jgi:hypothetical protein
VRVYTKSPLVFAIIGIIFFSFSTVMKSMIFIKQIKIIQIVISVIVSTVISVLQFFLSGVPLDCYSISSTHNKGLNI